MKYYIGLLLFLLPLILIESCNVTPSPPVIGKIYGVEKYAVELLKRYPETKKNDLKEKEASKVFAKESLALIKDKELLQEFPLEIVSIEEYKKDKAVIHLHQMGTISLDTVTITGDFFVVVDKRMCINIDQTRGKSFYVYGVKNVKRVNEKISDYAPGHIVYTATTEIDSKGLLHSGYSFNFGNYVLEADSISESYKR